jgi:hypothetical protein
VAGLLLSYFIVFADFGGVLALFYGWLVVGDRLGPFYVSLLRKKKKKKKKMNLFYIPQVHHRGPRRVRAADHVVGDAAHDGVVRGLAGCLFFNDIWGFF